MKHLIATIALTLCSLTISAQYGEYVGGDISLLPAYEEHNSSYLDANRKKIDDLLVWFVNECKWNTFRVRLFVNPDNSNHDGVIQDLEYVKKLGKRIKDAGAHFMLDFHYSDTWADPTSQKLPAAWSSCITADEKADKLYAYTKEALTALKAYGADPDFVQVGNEITSGIVDVWRSTDAAGFVKIVEKGCDAVHEVCPQAKVVIHTESPQNTNEIVNFYNALNKQKYDIIGISYYPIWHQSIDHLSATINKLEQSFPDKKIQIVETAYNFQNWPTEGVAWNCSTIWPCSADGQYNFVKDLINKLKTHKNVNGLLYWFPEEAGNGDDTDWGKQKYGNVITYWVNRGLWWEDTKKTGHSPVQGSMGMVHYLMKDFLSQQTLDITETAIQKEAKVKGIFNMQGQRLKDIPAHGLYILNGKTFTAR